MSSNTSEECVHCNGCGLDPCSETELPCPKCHGSGISDWRDKYIVRRSASLFAIFINGDEVGVMASHQDAKAAVTFLATHIERISQDG